MKAGIAAFIAVTVAICVPAGSTCPPKVAASITQTAATEERIVQSLGPRWSALRVAVSPDGRRVAILFIENRTVEDRVNVYSLSSGKVTATLKGMAVGQNLEQLAWHPARPILAVSGGHEWFPNDPTPAGMVFLMDARSGRIVRKLEVGGDPQAPLAWLPDRRTILTDAYLLDTRTDRLSDGRVPGLASLEGNIGSLDAGPRWTIAAEVWPPVPEEKFYLEESKAAQIEVYRRLPGKRLRYALLATLRPDKGKSGKITSFRTEPAFLENGRLAYARVFLGPDGKRQRVELWTSRPDGKDERKWLGLPLIPATEPPLGGSDGKYRLTPVSWSRDGRVLAYTLDNQIHVKGVRPPAAR